ncbi:MAG TPA: hypothetical protein PLE83_12065 [Myxococcota bacterium]|nr:hypothetical protein [Myxococcota bacterium]
MRAANRNNNLPGNRNDNVGFRLASSRPNTRSSEFTDSDPVCRHRPVPQNLCRSNADEEPPGAPVW